jgi:hypothetical protein
VAAPAKPVPRDLLFALDTPAAVSITPREAYIKGWFVPPVEYSCELALSLGDERIPVFTGLSRPDVARHYANNPVFKYCGFVAHLPRAVSAGSARLVARTAEAEFVLAENIVVSAAEALPSDPLRIALPSTPLISLLIPVHDPQAYPLVRTIESIRRQSYSHWQICLIVQSQAFFNAPPDFLTSDPKIVFSPDAAAVQGEFVLYMNPGDELEPYALEEYVSELLQGAAVVYADEREIDLYGERGSSWKKPDFDPEAFRAWDFIGNGAALRRSTLRNVLLESQPALQPITETLAPDRIHHIAKVLYYTRKPNRDQARKVQAEDAEPGLFRGSIRLNRPLLANCSIALILREEDGLFQRTALGPALDRSLTRVYEQRPAELAEDVAIFINGPLDTVNHAFVEELAAQALRPEIGLVTGIALDRKGRILHAGLSRTDQGELRHPFAGLAFRDRDLPRQVSVVRSIDAAAPYFFAVRREHFHTLQITPAITAPAGLQALVTPYAIATFDIMSDEAMAQNESNTDGSETLPQVASERNYLRRELAETREALAQLEVTRCTDWKARVKDLEEEVKKQEQLRAELLNSPSWKWTRPLRACMRLVRGK